MSSSQKPQDGQQLLTQYQELIGQVKQIKMTMERLQDLVAQVGEWENLNLAPELDDNLAILHSIFHGCSDVVFRSFKISGNQRAALIYVDGMVDKNFLDRDVLGALMDPDQDFLTNDLAEVKLPVAEVETRGIVADLVDLVMQGDAAVLVDGWSKVLILGLRDWKMRAIQEPLAEAVIRGSREGFIENLVTNITLLRRRLKTPDFKVDNLYIGKLTKTRVAVAYIKGIANGQLVQEVKNRLERIEIDGVIGVGYLEEFIEDSPWSLFPQAVATERPDAVVGNLLEGRVAILTDGDCFAIIVPATIWQFYQSTEDYYERPYMSTFLRWLRYIFTNIALVFPSFYVAITTFHQEMLPTSILLTIAAAREAIPYPAFVEAFATEITFEVLREAGVRLPRPVGQAVSIVGVLVIGEAAVNAGLISAPMVIIVSMTGIASFIIPHHNGTIPIRLLRFPMLIMAGTLGLFGIMITLLIILVHLCSLRSFGVPYLSPIAPLSAGDLKDVAARVPWWMMKLRPRLTGYENPQRQGPGSSRLSSRPRWR